jgi:L-alanine-DL-glutamate epimerase-like enolase superfamily enzyme
MTLDGEGCIAIPAGAGFGVEPDEERIATLTVDTRRVSLV